MRRANDRADVARVLDAVEIYEEVAGRLRPALLVHADHSGPGPECAHRIEQLGLYVDTGSEDELRVGPNEILPLRAEQPELCPPALLLELPDGLELVVVG